MPKQSSVVVPRIVPLLWGVGVSVVVWEAAQKAGWTLRGIWTLDLLVDAIFSAIIFTVGAYTLGRWLLRKMYGIELNSAPRVRFATHPQPPRSQDDSGA